MAIVPMKHLSLIALQKDRDALLHDLSKLGVVQISESSGESLEKERSDLGKFKAQRSEIVGALEVLGKYVKVKSGLFPQREQVAAETFFASETIDDALEIAKEVNSISREIATLFANESRLIAKKDSLVPWKGIDVPLETVSGKRYFLSFGTIPAKFSVEEIKNQLAEIKSAYLECPSSDKEQHYVLVMCHDGEKEVLADTLRTLSFSKVSFKDTTGLVSENIASIEEEITKSGEKRKSLAEEFSKMGDSIPKLKLAYDALSVQIEKAEAQEKLLSTAKTVILNGWFPAREKGKLEKLFESYGAAYEMRDPLDEEEPPTLTYNSKLVEPYSMITNMYSPPAYRGIDPNPFMAPFFAIFFGIMFSDAAYGILLTLVSSIVLLKFKPRGGTRQLMAMAAMCGVTTFVWGVLFGGFFGDAIPTVYKMITGKPFGFELAVWFNPMKEPMTMLIFSFAFGGIHIFAGMAIQAYMMIRDGKLLDAIFDIGSWWVLFGGIVFALLGLTNVGLILIGVGALALLLTQGRNEKKFFKKITKGLASLYDITGFLGDILSYSRLLALSLATAVIASVINTMGAMTGPVGFVIVFLIGHTFNIAVNLIGTYVHTSRLQYVEFFGKFYQGGGEEFSPLDTKTKYVDIIKEEK
ncbi:MAG: V-type ATP synthase subunit I [Clostridia bacterium]|nr:V-type ATP synthase subunit I [Clostridia bacterium]